MHVNVYEENIREVTPIRVQTKQKNGIVYHGVTIVLEGAHNQITVWSRSKERLSSLLHGLGVMIDAGVREGSLETPSCNRLNFAAMSNGCGTISN